MKKKILIFIGTLGLGGTEKQLLKIISSLKDYFEIEICCLLEGGVLIPEFKDLGLKVSVPGTRFFLINQLVLKYRVFKIFYIFFSVFKRVFSSKAKVVHFYLPESYILGGWTSYIFRRKFFIMSRRSLNNYQKKYFFSKEIESFCHKRIDLIISNSTAVKNQLINEEKVNKKKCITIHNGVKIIPRLKRSNRKTVNILYLANLLPYKRHDLLLDACSRIPKKYKWQLNLLGYDNFNLIKNLRKKHSQLFLKKKVIYHGQKKEISKYLMNSDIGVLVSDEEGFSNAILEYMSFGLPVIASKVGGNLEAVEDNISGYLFKKNNSIELSHKILELIRSKSKREEFGKNGYEKVKRDFNILKKIDEYKKLYESIFKKVI